MGTSIKNAWLMRRPDRGALVAVGLAGLGVLVMDAITPEGSALDLGRALRVGYDAPFGNVNYAVHMGLPLALVGVAFLLRTNRRHAWMLGGATCMAAVYSSIKSASGA